MIEPTIVVKAWRWRRYQWRIVQHIATGAVVDEVRNHSSLRALRKVDLMPGAMVKVYVPAIVHQKRAP